MIVPELFLYISFSVCFIVGVSLNALLVWLIVNRSPQKMRQYRPILLLSTFTNIIYLTDAFLVMPVVAVKDSLFVFFSLGLFSSLPNPWGFIALVTWEYLLAFSEFSIAVPFVYRYYVICRGKKWGLKEFLLMLLVPITLCVEHCTLLYYVGYINNVEDQLAGNEYVGFPADSNKTYVIPFFTKTQALASAVAYNLAFFSGMNYLLIVIFGRRLYRHLNAMVEPHFSQEQVRALNKQISTTLIFQAVIPLLVEFVPTIYSVGTVVIGINFNNSTLYLTSTNMWIPVLNPLVTMWVVRAYRREIWGVFSKFATSVSVVMPEMPGSRVAPSNTPPQIAVNTIREREGHGRGANA